jgi:phytoene synthase
LGAPDPEAARPFGAAYGVAGLLRSTNVLAAQQTCLLPRELLHAHSLSAESFIDNPASDAARAALEALVRQGQALLSEARHNPLPRQAVAAILPAVLARRDLARWPTVALPRRLGDRLAVVLAGLTGSV